MMAKKEFKNAISVYKEQNRSDLQESVKRQEALKQIRKEQGLDRERHVSGRISLGKLVFLFLIIALLFRVLQGMEMPTFASLLERLRTMPSIPNGIFKWEPDLGDWGIFSFIKDWFEAGITGFGMVLGLVAALLNCIPLIWNIVVWIYGG